jgi:hypothetical protein
VLSLILEVFIRPEGQCVNTAVQIVLIVCLTIIAIVALALRANRPKNGR